MAKEVKNKESNQLLFAKKIYFTISILFVCMLGVMGAMFFGVVSNSDNIATATNNTLDSPSFVVMDFNRVLRWGAVAGADSFTVRLVSNYTDNIHFVMSGDITHFDTLSMNLQDDVFYTPSVIAHSSDSTILCSNPTYASPFRITTLFTPVPSIGRMSATISWPSISGALGYSVWLNFNLLHDRFLDNSINLANYTLQAGINNLQVMALGDNGYFSRNSTNGQLSFEVVELSAPVLTVVEMDETFIWSSVSNAIEYQVEIQFSGGGSETRMVTGHRYITLDSLNLLGGESATITVSAIGRNVLYVGSNPSLPITARKLAAPAIMLNSASTLEVSWQPIPHATSYNVFVNGILHTTTATHFNLASLNLPVGNHTIIVYAVNNADATVLTSNQSNAVTFGIARLGTPNITLDGHVLSWDNITNTDRYIVRLNGQERIITTPPFNATEFALALGINNITVTAVSDSPLFLDSSPATQSIMVMQVAIPNISFVRNTLTLTWGSVANATGFRVFLGDQSFNLNSNELSFVVSNFYLSESANHISVVALGNDILLRDSSPAIYNVQVVRLGAPANFYFDETNDKLTWNAVSNSLRYRVVVSAMGQGLIIRYIENATYLDLLQFDLSFGIHIATIIAIGCGVLYLNSFQRNTNIVIREPVQLASPLNFSFHSGSMMLSWKVVVNAVSYRIVMPGIAGSPFIVTDATTLNLSGVNFSSYGYRALIIAIGDDRWFLDSQEVGINIILRSLQLDTPTNLYFCNETQILSWNGVTNSSGYRVYVGTQVFTATNTTFDLLPHNLSVGTHTIAIRAFCNNDLFEDSFSTQITILILENVYSPTVEPSTPTPTPDMPIIESPTPLPVEPREPFEHWWAIGVGAGGGALVLSIIIVTIIVNEKNKKMSK